ncbi:unconventional prefoldin RPB5 interactor 1, partial [Tremellales sp. Uapishka_1]
MPEDIRYPIQPPTSSLEASLQTLSLLSARLASLPSKASHPVSIPFTSKARFAGEIIDTNNVRVGLGEGWFVDMSAEEARAYVERRKNDLLEGEMARLGYGREAKVVDNMEEKRGKRDIPFDPAFSLTTPVAATKEETPEVTPVPRAGPVILDETRPTVQETSIEESLQSLVDLVGHQIEERLHIPKGEGEGGGEGKGKGKGTGLQKDQNLLNDEGLPIHEIRESPDGTPLDPVPSSADAADFVVETPTFGAEDDYWSEEAIARRAALRRKVFNEGSVSSDDDEEEEEGEGEDEEPALNSVVEEEEVEPARPLLPSSLSSSTIPKSILKPPARKKSVSFDASVPLPPESPIRTETGMGFPVPSTQTAEFEPRVVPIIAAPRKEDKGFAGFKKGFLKGSAVNTEVKENTPTPAPTPALSEIPAPPKKTSLFAQRKALQANSLTPQASSPSSTAQQNVAPLTTPKTSLGLPKLSQNKPMASMKNAVVEKMVVPEAVAEQQVTENKRIEGQGELAEEEEEEEEAWDEDGDDGDGDLGEYSDDEEDEYDLDEALLAREVALDYHRRKQWIPTNEDDEVEQGWVGDDGEIAGGVMLGLPQITDDDTTLTPRIVNPTPDDLGKFIRVGRLENGNLVLAPGQEEVDEEGGEKQRNREEVMRKLMVGDMTDTVDVEKARREEEERERERKEREEAAWRRSLPPSVVESTIVERIEQAERIEGKPREEEEEKPKKKVSKFKAARQGLQ